VSGFGSCIRASSVNADLIATSKGMVMMTHNNPTGKLEIGRPLEGQVRAAMGTEARAE